ncbi:MAG: DUF1513 domain-containing protein, partial [Pseudomonadota bacterium]
LKPAGMDAHSLHGLDGYIGSVSAFGRSYAASSPRGNRAFRFDDTGGLTATYPAPDICGLCAAPDGTCLATDGLGQVHRLSNDGLQRLRGHSLAFDNHLVALT